MARPKDIDEAVDVLCEHVRRVGATDPAKARAFVAEMKDQMRAIFEEKGLPVPEELDGLDEMTT